MAKSLLVRFIRKNPWLIHITHWIWRHFQARYSAGAVGVLFNADGHVLLVEHAFHTKHVWGLPGGWVDRREDPADTVQRELREELSIEVYVDAILLVEKPFPAHLDFAYLCSAPNDEIGELSYELLGYGWYDLNNLPNISPFHRSAIQKGWEVKNGIQTLR